MVEQVSLVRRVVVGVFLLTLGVEVRGQCTTSWSPQGAAGTNGITVAATRWDPDGPGPAPALQVLGGWFNAAGTAQASRVVVHDPVGGTWTALGQGFDGPVLSLFVRTTGELVAGGLFTSSGANPTLGVAQWNGSSWDPLGAGVNGGVYALAELPGGHVVAGGLFSMAGGSPANSLAAWSGTSWSPIGGGVSGGTALVTSLVSATNGDLYVGGQFTFAGNVVARSVARWNGAAWSALGTGTTGVVNSLVFAGGNLVAGGQYSNIGGVATSNVASWNGTAWAPFGSGVAGIVKALQVHPGGGLLAGTSGTSPDLLHHWNGSAWAQLPGAPTSSGFADAVFGLAPSPAGGVMVVGSFALANGARNVVHMDAAGTFAMSTVAFDGPVHSMARMPNGDVIAGGDFLHCGGIAANRVARFDGNSWSPLGAGVDGSIESVVGLPNGDIVVRGWFTTAGSVAANRVARWNGTVWSPLGGGLAGVPGRLAALPNGDVYCAIYASHIYRWDGNSWTQLPPLGPPGAQVHAAIAWNGLLVVAGAFSPQYVYLWNGTSWSGLPVPLAPTRALAVGPAGELLLGSGSSVVRWNGLTSSMIGAPLPADIFSIAVTADGGIAAAHAGATPLSVSKWDGVAWQPVGAGLVPLTTPGPAAVLVARQDGDLLLGGSLLGVPGGAASMYFATWGTSCPASVTTSAAGCAGSLTATSSPWVGTTFRTQGAGLPALGLAVVVTGIGPVNVPLAAILPQGVPGCDLSVSPDLLVAQLPQLGAVTATLALPASPSLAGQSFRQQVVAIAMDASGSFLSVTSTNALLATIGSY